MSWENSSEILELKIVEKSVCKMWIHFCKTCYSYALGACMWLSGCTCIRNELFLIGEWISPSWMCLFYFVWESFNWNLICLYKFCVEWRASIFPIYVFCLCENIARFTGRSKAIWSLATTIDYALHHLQFMKTIFHVNNWS